MQTRAARWGTALLPIVATVLQGSDALGQVVCNGVSPIFNTNLTRVTVASGLTTGQSGPLFITAPPGDVTRIFIVLQNGAIRQLQRGDGPTAHTLFLDIDARVGSLGFEQGLLGLAFSPNFAADGYFYVNYTRDDGDTIISRFKTLDGTPKSNGDPASETILLRIDQPESNHNGGWIGFGPDGFLYIAQGDGGGGGDGHGVCGNGQSLATLLGKLLRIDPTATVGTAPDCGLDAGPYKIPPGNPFTDGPASGICDEIWAYGLRNPWRDSFDAATGDLYIGEVGEACWEEVDRAPATSTGGENYGWRQFEGRHCYDSLQGCNATSSPVGCPTACNDPAPVGDPAPNGTVLPIWDYAHGADCSIVGGYVYRGCRMPNFRGKYFYGDYCTGSVLSFVPAGGVPTNHQAWTAQLGAGLAFGLSSFGSDAQGELYFADRDGLIYTASPPFPEFEVSGDGAAKPLLMSKVGDWTWENLQQTSWQPVGSYKIYRANVADGRFEADEVFDCVRSSATPFWPTGGDLVNPAAGRMFAYIVTAQNVAAEQTSPGGTPVRTLSMLGCP